MTSPFRRVGLELELLAPPGLNRSLVARALARRVRGRVQHGLKYWSEGTLPDGRPLCRLSSAARVLDATGRVLVTLVDDNTLRAALPARPTRRALFATDDLRLALLAERLCWSARAEPRAVLAPLARVFEASLGPRGLCDPWGHPLLVAMAEPSSFSRVCEVVTRPLSGPAERGRVVGLVLQAARELGLTVPAEAALHAHYDAGPWRRTAPLRRLILHSSQRRQAWLAALRPNPRCRKLGPFAPRVVRVAREGEGVPFRTFAAALSLAGVEKHGDLNVLGVVEPFPRQPTLEVRCLPMALDEAAVLGSLAAAEGLLAAALRGEDR